MIDAAGKNTLDASQGRIWRLVIVAIGKRIDAGDRRVVEAHNLLLRFQQPVCKAQEGHRAVGEAEKARRHPEKTGSAHEHPGLLVRVVRLAHKEEVREFARSKALDFPPLRLTRRSRREY